MAKKSKKSKKEMAENNQGAEKELLDTEINKEEQQKEAVDENKSDGTEEKNDAKEWHDKYLRLSAEFDNYRKRTLKEKMELSKIAGADIFIRLLPVIDDFERAIQSLENVQDIEAFKEGIFLIYGKFQEFLKQQGVMEIEAKEKEFDTDVHEAVTKIPAPDKKLKGKVVDVIEKGYFINEKVLRYSKVVIGE